MSQRISGYARKERDLYRTPAWVTEALLPLLRPTHFWEPADGMGDMSKVLAKLGPVTGTDISSGCDFLRTRKPPHVMCAAIVTNPPYNLATEFIEHSLDLMKPVEGFVAMLLRTDFDHANGRRHLFADHSAFATKLVLTKRIQWFKPEPGAKGKSPSFNHAWFVWDWRHEGPPTLLYGPQQDAKRLA